MWETGNILLTPSRIAKMGATTLPENGGHLRLQKCGQVFCLLNSVKEFSIVMFDYLDIQNAGLRCGNDNK